MHFPNSLVWLIHSLGLVATAHSHSNADEDPVPLQTRQYWMHRAIDALNEVSPCPFGAFGAVIVNHTAADPEDGGLGQLVCTGVNRVLAEGNPTLHGEVSAINNCTRILTDADGPYGLSGPEALKAMGDLSLYTTAEACPMCTAAIIYGGFREYIYSTSIPTLQAHGWPQIGIRSTEVFSRSQGRASVNHTRIVGGVLAEETEGLFTWQFGPGRCPKGCVREDKEQGKEGWCVAKEEEASNKIPDREL